MGAVYRLKLPKLLSKRGGLSSWTRFTDCLSVIGWSRVSVECPHLHGLMLCEQTPTTCLGTRERYNGGPPLLLYRVDTYAWRGSASLCGQGERIFVKTGTENACLSRSFFVLLI